MSNSLRYKNQWSMAIAGFAALALMFPAQAQEATNGDRQISQSVEVESTEVESTEVEAESTETEVYEVQSYEVQTIERRTVEVRSVEVETSETEVRTAEVMQVAVLNAIAQRTSINANQLRVLEVSQRTWSDSCLGLDGNGPCTQATVPGYLVTVTNGQDVWVCRSSNDGSVVYLDEVATRVRMAQMRVRSRNVSFSDVRTNYWAAPYIRELAALNIISGYPDGLYRPDKVVTRAEFAAIISQAFNVEDIREAINFLDVSENYWASSAINVAYEKGFLEVVSNNRFLPFSEMMRSDVLVAIARGLNLTASTSDVSLLSRYTDANLTSGEVRLLLAALAKQGILTNYTSNTELNLNRLATRSEVAVLVYQALYSMGYVARIDSPYVVQSTTVYTNVNTVDIDDDNSAIDIDDDDDNEGARRQNCNQGIGNGAEGCDPGNSRPHGGSNDETGRTPGNRR